MYCSYICHTCSLNFHYSYMPPCTVHFVVTIKDSFFVGGHFYTITRMGSTLGGLILEHHNGMMVTNTVHQEILIIVFKFVQFMFHCLVDLEETSLEDGLDGGLNLDDLEAFGESKLHL